MILTEIAKGETIEVPAVGGIAKRTEIGVVRRDDKGATARREQAMKLFYSADHIGDMLDDVNGTELMKRVVAKWERKAVEIGNDVCARIWIAIDTNGARMLVQPTADIKNQQIV